MRGAVESLPELWDEQQYSREYDLEDFMHSLAPQTS